MLGSTDNGRRFAFFGPGEVVPDPPDEEIEQEEEDDEEAAFPHHVGRVRHFILEISICRVANINLPYCRQMADKILFRVPLRAS